MLVCEKMRASPDILRAPLNLVIHHGSVQFARPLFNWNGTRVVGSEMGTGSLDGGGKLHLTSSWDNAGVIFQADYSGTLAASGGTFIGKQSWRSPQGLEGGRTCTAALVPDPVGQRPAVQQ